MKDDRVLLQHTWDAIEEIEAYARPASVTGKACVRRSRIDAILSVLEVVVSRAGMRR